MSLADRILAGYVVGLDIPDEINKLLAEARRDEAKRCAADVCERCFSNEEWWPASRDPNGIWWHTRAKHSEPGRHNTVLCNACTIHERLHRESLGKSVDK